MDKETRVKLDIYFKGELSEDEVYEKLKEVLKETDYQIYEMEIQ